MDSLRIQALREGQQENAISFGPKFRVQRFYLDKTLDRFTQNETGHFFGSGIKSFWVCDTNNKAFVAKIVPNPSSDRIKGSGLPLLFNLNQSFSVPVHDACLEFTAQPNVWVDIAYSESEDIQIGSVSATLTGSFAIDEGATMSDGKVQGTGAALLLLPADSTRRKATIQVKTGSFQIGTQANVTDPLSSLTVTSEYDILTTGAVYCLGDSSSILSLTIFKA